MSNSFFIRRFQILLSTAVLSCALMLMPACGATDDSDANLKDAYGREVSLPSKVEKVATVGSGARFVVYAGAQDKLVVVTDMDKKNSPTMPYTQVYADIFAALPSTSNGNHLNETTVDVEKLMELKPDVIISSRSKEECDALQKQSGIPVVGISYQNQLFTDAVYTSIEAVGKACGTSNHAAKVVKQMKKWASELEGYAAGKDKDSQLTCYVGAINYKGSKGFTGTFACYAPLEAIGAINVADELGSGSYEVSLEQIYTWNPDVMFLNMANVSLMDNEYSANPVFFQGLKAFKNNAIYSQPSFNYNGTNVEMGIADAYFCASVLYPDSFANADMAKKYDEIFEVMLGQAYYDTLKASGIDFVKVERWNQ